MYGKVFNALYAGSMVGAGCEVFALWGYCISTARDGYVEINPKLLASVFGCEPEVVESALRYLTSPDDESRTPDEDGCRLVQEGQFMYRVVNWESYRAIRDEEALREYYREQKRKQRAKTVDDVLRQEQLSQEVQVPCPPDTDTDSEADSEEDTHGVELALDGAPPRSPSAVMKEQADDLIQFLNFRCKRQFPSSEANLRPVIALLKSGYSVPVLEHTISVMQQQWADRPEMKQYLRPDTLFRKSNFEGKYLPLVAEEYPGILETCSAAVQRMFKGAKA